MSKKDAPLIESAAEETKSHEEWAELEGMHEARIVRTLGRSELNPTYWRYRAAIALSQWKTGQLVTASEFRAAVERAASEPLHT